MVHKGYRQSEEHKKRISDALNGKRHSGETKRKISKKMKGKQHSLGYKHTEKAKQKMSEMSRGNKSFSGHRHTEETKTKVSGKNNPSWKGGVSFGKYCPKFNEQFKESIREKFGRQCFICGAEEKENGRKLDVHHVDYNKMQGCDDHEWRLVPLCRSCHMKTNNNREYYEMMIIEKLEELNWEK